MARERNMAATRERELTERAETQLQHVRARASTDNQADRARTEDDRRRLQLEHVRRGFFLSGLSLD